METGIVTLDRIIADAMEYRFNNIADAECMLGTLYTQIADDADADALCGLDFDIERDGGYWKIVWAD